MNMNMKNYFLLFAFCFGLFACAGYKTPPRENWPAILAGATSDTMTPTSKIAKRPILLGRGGKVIEESKSRAYMENVEYELYDALRKPGIQTMRAGGDVVVLIVRDSFMQHDAPEISEDGADTLSRIAKILKKYDATFIEIAGYTDSIRDVAQAQALSADMANRVAIFFAQNGVNPVRMFIQGRGSARPISSQDYTGRKMNRRVEIKISPAFSSPKPKAQSPKPVVAQQPVSDQAPAIVDYGLEPMNY
jgi:outer membrane protein OmpA-like peptidoglycan-associated protein